MKLRECEQCGGPRRSLTNPLCSKCRKHPKEPCTDCGGTKGVGQARCLRCHIRAQNYARRGTARPVKERRSDTCPQCGGSKYVVSALCMPCYRSAQNKSRVCPRCDGAKARQSARCHECRYGNPRRHGWTVNEEGRILIYMGDNTYTPRARMVMRAILRRELEHSEHVHHINGIKYDDRPSNLLVLSASEHARLHGLQRRERAR